MLLLPVFDTDWFIFQYASHRIVYWSVSNFNMVHTVWTTEYSSLIKKLYT